MGTDKADQLQGSESDRHRCFLNLVIKTLKAWEICAPVLAANGGWALFNFTPNGRGHGYDLYRRALGDPSWFTEVLSIQQTKKDGPGRTAGR